MSVFIKKILCFVLIIGFIYSIPLFLLFFSGELYPLDYICYLSEKNHNSVVGLAYTEIKSPYKLRMAQKVNPDVLALGTSRIMAVSSEWFNPNYSFYNAGGGIVELSDVPVFLSELKKQPRLLLLNLDQFNFNKNASFRKSASYGYQYAPGDILRANTKKVLKDFYKKKFAITDLFDTDKIGMTACAKSDGYRQDGSRQMMSYCLHPEIQSDFKFENTFARIDEGRDRFEYSEDVDSSTVQDIRHIISYCSAHKIKLIAFLPPFAPSVWNYLMKDQRYSYMTKIADSIRDFFDQDNYYLYEFNSGDDVGSPDYEFIDGFHGYFSTYLRMLIKMKKDCSFLNLYSKESQELIKLFNKDEYKCHFQ